VFHDAAEPVKDFPARRERLMVLGLSPRETPQPARGTRAKKIRSEAGTRKES